MSTALWIALMAVGIALIPLFIANNASKANEKKPGDGGTTPLASDSSSDCSPGDAGGCDGGGGGGGGD